MFVALRDLRHAKGRFALMATVIVLMTVLIGMLSGLTQGLAHQSTSAITGLPADHIALQSPPPGQKASYSESAITDSQLRRWAQTPGVQRAEPLGITTTRAQAGESRTAVSVFGVEQGSGQSRDPVTGSDAVVSRPAARALGVHVGDTVTVGGQRLLVSHIGGEDWFSHTPVVWTTLTTWQQMAPPGTDATAIALTTHRGVDIDAADRSIGTTTTTTAGSVTAIGSYTSENGSLQLMRALLFAISALIVGAFFTVWTMQRGADIAVLKALGASTPSLLRDAVGQAVILLVGGTTLGALITAGAGAAAVSTTTIPFALTPGTILVPAAVLVALGALGAALSIRTVTSVDPLTTLGSTR